MTDAEKATRERMSRQMTGSSSFRGGLRITSWSMESTPSDWLGGPVDSISVKCHVSDNVGRVGTGALTVHKDVDEQDLHRIARIAQPEHCAQRDERERRRRGAELERQDVLDVVEYRPSCNIVLEVSTMGLGDDAYDVPSSMAGRMVPKLSSTRMTSAASFATSVPLLPIDTPISAILSAGASLTTARARNTRIRA